MMSLTIYALGRAAGDQIHQQSYSRVIDPAFREAVWTPAQQGITLATWWSEVRTLDPTTTAYEAFLSLRQSRLLIEWPLTYLGYPGPDLESLLIAPQDPEAVPALWPHRAVWGRVQSLATLLATLAQEYGVSYPVACDLLIPTVLAHPATLLLDLETRAPFEEGVV